MKGFDSAVLERVYRSVSLAQQSGELRSPHDPLETTAWIHITVADLERLDDACIEILTGSDAALDVLASISRFDMPLVLPEARPPSEDRAAAGATFELVDPVALAVVAHVLATRGGEQGAELAHRLIAFAARRAAGLNLVVDSANRYLAGWWTARRFAARLRELSPFEVGRHHLQDAGGGHANDHDHDGNGGSARVHNDCACIDHQTLTLAYARAWRALLETARAEAKATEFPESPERSLYERVADRINVRARVLTAAKSTASPVSFDERQREGEDGESQTTGLLIAPCSSAVAVNEALHVFVRITGEEHLDDTEVDVHASTGERIRVTVPGDVREALVSLPASTRPGSVRISATASIYDRGLEAPDVTVDVVRERPRCAPHEGGSWELAKVEAHQQVDACSPARWLGEVASRGRGYAGALITGAYDAIVVGTQLCVQRAETRRCAQAREEAVRQCTQSRDEGYSRCTQTRDEGYSRCCDWWPCSWFCSAWVWFSSIVCVAWEWIKNVVCVAWEVIKAIVCVLGSVLVGLLKLGFGIAVLLGSIGIATAAGIVRLPCRIFGIQTREEVLPTLKVVGIHAVLLRTGRVLLFSYDEGVFPVDRDHPADFSAAADSDAALCAVWDPATGRAEYRSLPRNLFCAHHSFLPDGRVFVNSGQFPLPGLLKSLWPPRLLAPGADKDVHLFDPISEKWTRQPDMEFGRWYPTCITLAEGRVWVASGTNGWATSPGLGRGIQNTYEFADTTGQVSGPIRTPFFWFHLYPFAHMLPSGLVFTHSKRTTRLFDPCNGSWRRIAPAVGIDAAPGDTLWPFSRSGPGPGTSVLLPLRPEERDGEWVYPAGRVMILGGGGAEAAPEPEIRGETYDLRADTPATRTVEILDLEEQNPRWRWAMQHMANGRVMPDTVMLPDGNVLVVGGGRFGKSGGLLAHFASVERGGEPDKGALDPVLEPELFDPESETWRPLCRKPIGRLYHTSSLLLADGRVLVAGHDGALNMQPYDRSRYELEIFSPPYLYRSDGSLAPRPVIDAAPVSIDYGSQFEISVNGSVRDVALIRPSAVTHQLNTEQRYVGLPLFHGETGGTYTATAPPPGGVAPPGWYLLFVTDIDGTPSVGHWIELRRSAPQL